MSTSRNGFTLIEVILAFTIACSGIIGLYGGVTNCLHAEERRLFYDSCAGFLDLKLEPLIASRDWFSTGQEKIEGTIVTEGLPVGYTVESRPYQDASSDNVRRVYQLTITFRGTIASVPVQETVVTYLQPDLKVRQATPPAGGGS